MPENPLLPHAELRALLARTKRCAILESAVAPKAGVRPARGITARHTGREAVLAATTLQLGTGDLWITEPGDLIAAELSPADPAKALQTAILPSEFSKGTSRLLLATAMAAALKEAGTDRVALVLFQTRAADPAWQAALTWSQERLLPLLLVCTDASGPMAFTKTRQSSPTLFQWSNVSLLAGKQKLPVLTVDGEDAVAMYRTAQEAILRARSGGGPAVLWAALPTPAVLTARSRTQRPVNRLAQYLRTRGISVA